MLMEPFEAPTCCAPALPLYGPPAPSLLSPAPSLLSPAPSLLPRAPSVLPLKWPCSLSRPGTAILNPKFGVYIIYIYIYITKHISSEYWPLPRSGSESRKQSQAAYYELRKSIKGLVKARASLFPTAHCAFRRVSQPSDSGADNLRCPSRPIRCFISHRATHQLCWQGSANARTRHVASRLGRSKRASQFTASSNSQ